MGSLDTAPHAIPTIDISPFLSLSAPSDDVQNVVKAMSDACHTYGFFYLVGHGISLEDQNTALRCAKRFFDLPLEERMEFWVKKSVGMSFRGYEPPENQTHHKDLLPDTKEGFVIGAEISPDHPDSGSFGAGPNLWPKSIPDNEFRTPIMEYQDKMVNLVKKLLEILARGLPKEWDCPPDVLDEVAVNPSIPMRLLHYAPQAVKDDRQFGVGDHSDFGCVTILLQEPDAEGLEVFYPPTESWIPVPVKKGSYVVNMGDMMQKWTGRYYRSARHRVVTSTTRHRYSVLFFLNGNLKLNCKALDGSGTETIVGEHIRGRIMETVKGTA